jgi:hypothetical protein
MDMGKIPETGNWSQGQEVVLAVAGLGDITATTTGARAAGSCRIIF